MRHLGDITKIHGYEIPFVDIICGGSPCQDLSVAGKREGLAGKRSGLFMEQIRIVKEMRNESARQLQLRGSDDNVGIVPRYMVWENVPGAFSSNKGEDFRAVLEETAKVADENATIPRLERGGRWTPVGCIVGDGWSIAWRVHDAQYWGVPQRRKRICLLADFNGDSAGKILFESQRETNGIYGESAFMDFGNQTRSKVQPIGEGMPRNTEPSATQGQETAGAIGDSTEETGTAYLLKIRGEVERDSYGKKAGKGPLIQTEKSATLGVAQDQTLIRVYGICSYDSNAMKSSNPNSGVYEAETARTLDNNGGNPACNQGGMAVVQDATYQKTTGALMASGYDKLDTQEAMNDMYVVQTAWDGSQVSPTLTANNAGGEQRMQDKDNFNAVISFTTEMTPKTDENQTAFSLRSRDYKDPQCITYGLDRASFNQGKNAQYDFRVEEEKISTQVAKGPGAVASFSKYIKSVVRRLTPMECERLQGFPDGWTDIGEWVDSKGKKHKAADSPRYKALGNSIALPFWEWMAHRICAYYDRPTTMGSLFDGIGGFPLVFSRCGCEPIWASEIEEFPIAVTKKRFEN